MPNFKLDISYDGTDFFGWQIQKNQRTVQGEITNALEVIFKDSKINLIGSGRTDTGVHAKHQIANVEIDTNLETNNIKNAINANTENDINVNNCQIVADEFHSRFSAIKRKYKYYIIKDTTPTKRYYSWVIEEDINIDLLNECAQFILGTHDFSSFCKSSSLKENNKCTILLSEWVFTEDELQFSIVSNRFLHHMVRFLVGTMLEVSKNRILFRDFENLFKNQKYDNMIVKAPAKGLFLNNVYYK